MTDPLAMLRRAITTASNDDQTIPGSPERVRHAERLDAMRGAVEEIERLRGEVAALKARDMIDYFTRKKQP